MTSAYLESQSAATEVSDLPSFVKDIRAPSAPFPSLHYWMPERTGDSEADYQRGREHFREAVEASFRPGAGMLLAYVLMAMFRNFGPMESGFVDALLDVAPFGVAPPRLTDEEIAAAATTPEDVGRLRALENPMFKAITVRHWLPDVMRLEILCLLSGSEGEWIGAAVTMLARLALNGARN